MIEPAAVHLVLPGEAPRGPAPASRYAAATASRSSARATSAGRSPIGAARTTTCGPCPGAEVFGLERDRPARRAAVEAVFTPAVRYVDPLADVTGVDELDALIAGAQQQFPGLEFRAVGHVDRHHDVCRFRWGLGPAGAEALVIGFDVVAVADDGRTTLVHGFLDRVRATA